MKKSTYLEVLRWIGVLPASIIVSVFGCFIFLFLMLLGEIFSGDLLIYIRHPEAFVFDHYFTSFVISVIFGYLMVVSSSIVAPRHKKVVAFSLFGLVAVFFGFILLFALLIIGISDSWRLIVNSVLCIVSAGVAAFSIGQSE